MIAAVTVEQVIEVVEDDLAKEHLRQYFPEPQQGGGMLYAGARFDLFAGGGDRLDTSDRITAEDLVAVSYLSIDVPADAALAVLEGDLGRRVTEHLRGVPVDKDLGSLEAASILEKPGSGWWAYETLRNRKRATTGPGFGPVTTAKLLARKRPRLFPVIDRIVRCAFGNPDDFWMSHQALFGAGPQLRSALRRAADSACVDPRIAEPRILDVIVWMRHKTEHREAAKSRRPCQGMFRANDVGGAG